MNKRMKFLLALGGIAAMAIGGGAIAMAATPSADNTITTCFSSANPTLRVIDAEAGQSCNSGETKLSWGGGMRFLTTWGDWSKVPMSNGYPIIRKGDVVRYDGDPKAFGCTTPKGSWVSVAGAYAYPCLETPQNWVPLALDGAAGVPGKNADAHWFNLDANGALTGSSDNGLTMYPYAGYAFVSIPNVDPSKCGLTASVTDYSSRVTATVQSYYGYVLVMTRDISTGSYTKAPVSVSVNCASYR